MKKAKREQSRDNREDHATPNIEEKPAKIGKLSKPIQKEAKPEPKPKPQKKKKAKEETKDGEKPPKLQAEKKPQAKIFNKIENFSEFVQSETRKYQKIRKQTIAKIPIEPQQVKKAVKALLAHFEHAKPQNNLLDTGDDFIYLEIVMGKVPMQYSIRPIQM